MSDKQSIIGSRNDTIVVKLPECEASDDVKRLTEFEDELLRKSELIRPGSAIFLLSSQSPLESVFYSTYFGEIFTFSLYGISEIP